MTTSQLYKSIVLSVILISVGANLSVAQETSPLHESTGLATQDSNHGIQDPALMQRYPRYVIQKQDVLLLTFPLSPELNQTVTVQPDGYVNLQNGGSVHAQGLSVPELVEAIKTAYVGTLHNPIVNVD